jgi:hypothetical protein
MKTLIIQVMPDIIIVKAYDSLKQEKHFNIFRYNYSAINTMKKSCWKRKAK